MALNARIGAYKIGGRGDGWSPLPLPAAFRGDVFDVLFDADEDAIAQIVARMDPASSRVFAYCLADREGPGTFYITYDPYSSSLLKADPTFEWLQWSLRIDNPLTQTMRCMREVPVELRTLDGLGLLDDPSIAAPTAIFLDTQGTELDILRGGERLIHDHTVAIVTEAEFVPLYDGQPLFGDLCRWLGERGFFFAGFTDGPHPLEPYRTPLGQRGRPMVGYCDALFLRRVETIVPAEQIAQLAFLALYWEQLAYAMHVLDRLAQCDLGSVESERTYVKFALEIDRARKAMPVLFPPSFTDMYPTHTESTDRFDPRFTREDFGRRMTERYADAQTRLLAQAPALELLVTDADSPIEHAYRAYGLVKQADAIKARRLSDVTEMLAEFGIGIERKDPSAV